MKHLRRKRKKLLKKNTMKMLKATLTPIIAIVMTTVNLQTKARNPEDHAIEVFQEMGTNGKYVFILN